jgi:hypothetical protein
MKALPLALLFVAMSLLVGCNAQSAIVAEVSEPILGYVPCV